MTKTEIQRTLAERGLRPLKQFGQNFLHDQNLCRWLVDESGAKLGEEILEIGPGLGALTALFLERGCKIIAMEKDRGLAQFLRDRFGANPLFHLREGDALDLLKNDALGFTRVVGNLPYNISTPLIMTLGDLTSPPQEMLFTLQKEMAQRLASQPGVKNYGAISVLVQAEYEVEMLRVFPATVFYPEPEVESAAIRLRRLNPILIEPQHRARFRDFVRQGFSQRRKKLSNLLHVNDSRRAEELSVQEWVEVFRTTKSV